MECAFVKFANQGYLNNIQCDDPYLCDKYKQNRTNIERCRDTRANCDNHHGGRIV